MTREVQFSNSRYGTKSVEKLKANSRSHGCHSREEVEMLADLSSRTALVTGGGQGIGRGIALKLAEQGADVAIADIND